MYVIKVALSAVCMKHNFKPFVLSTFVQTKVWEKYFCFADYVAGTKRLHKQNFLGNKQKTKFQHSSKLSLGSARDKSEFRDKINNERHDHAVNATG